MGSVRFWGVVILVLLLIAGLLFLLNAPQVLEDAPALQEKLTQLQERVRSTARSLTPADQAQDQAEQSEVVADNEASQADSVYTVPEDPELLMLLFDPAVGPRSGDGDVLPSLNDSDQPFRRGLADLDEGTLLESWLIDEELIRKFVVLVDNIAVGRLPRKHSILAPPKEPFTTIELNDHYRLDPGSYKRYDPYRQVFLAIDRDEAIQIYQRYYPLMQRAYAELGYPRRSFHQRFIQALDQLISSPVVDGPIDLVRPAVMYKFADPVLEAAPAAQKQLIRMGPNNMRLIQARLREYRRELVRFRHAQAG